MRDIANCCNIMIAEEEDNPHNVSIPESEGDRAVVGPSLQMVYVNKPLKLREVNIGTTTQPKLAKIGDYWDNDTINKVAKLLTEYQDLFPTKFSELKGIIGDLGVMHITLKPNARPIKQRPYRLNPKYKQKVKEELDKMLTAGIMS